MSRAATDELERTDQAFARNRLLATFPSSTIKRLRPHFRELTVTKDNYLFQQDEDMASVYFPTTAVISESQILEDGRMIEVAIIGREGAAGISSAFGVRRSINCSQVCIGGTVLRISSKYLRRELELDVSLNRLLHEYIARQMKHLSQKVICNTFHSVEQRFCSWLLMLQDRSDSRSLNVTHEHIARALGVHRPSVTCIAQSLREKTMIDYSRGRIVVKDRNKMEKNACICYSE